MVQLLYTASFSLSLSLWEVTPDPHQRSFWVEIIERVLKVIQEKVMVTMIADFLPQVFFVVQTSTVLDGDRLL